MRNNMLTPGNETTEYRIAKYLAAAGTALPSLSFIFGHYWPGMQTQANIVAISSALMGIAAVLGYTKSRSDIKQAVIEAQTEIAKQALLSAVPAGAQPAVAIAETIAAPIATAAISAGLETVEKVIAKKL